MAARKMFSLFFLSILMVLSSRSTAICCYQGGPLLLSLLRSPTGVDSSSTLVTLTSMYGSIYLCLQSASPIRIDWEMDLRVANIESTNVPINPVPATVPMDAIMGTPILAATDPLGTISAMEPKLAAATAPIEPNVPVANTTQVAGMIPIKVVAIDSTNAPTTPVVVYINVPVVAVFDSQSIEPFGSTMVPTKNSFGGPEGFIDFLANPTETTTEVPYLLDNMGLDAATTTILPIPREGRLEYDMGKSFLATSSMLFMFDDWLSKKSSPHTATIDEETPLVIARGAKRRSSMQNDNKLKKPSPPYCFKD
ncbi:hypothetical protein V6N13_040269 [Hibiscus sabdariffa]